MIDYSKWKTVSKAVTSLSLDSQNPRLPPTKGVPSQPELIAELIRHDKVYELAKSILDRGLYPSETVIAVEEHGKVVVVEGNRRIAALKLLISPALAPEKDRARFRMLSNKASFNSIRRIPVLLSPSRDAAAPLIQAKHTRREVESWSMVMQARFYAARIDDGVSVEQISRDYFITPSEVMEFLQNYQMYRIACNLELDPAIANRVNDTREFPLSVLERIFRNKEGMEFLGISFTANRELKGNIAVGEFQKGFAKIVSDIAIGKLTSRTLNTTEEFKKYFAGFGVDAPNPSKKGSFSAKDLLPSSSKSAMPKNVPPDLKKKTSPQRALIRKGFECGINDTRINALIKELKSVSADQYPNSVALSLRGLVDLVVGDYCDRVGATAVILQKARSDSKRPRPKDWYPSIRQMLNFLISQSGSFNLHPLALKAAKMLVEESSATSVLVLDAFAHNKFVTPTPTGLRSFWTQIEEPMKAMLAKPPEANAGS